MNRSQRLICLLSITLTCLFFFGFDLAAQKTKKQQVSQAAQDNLITLDLKDADIRGVLKLLADKSGFNIITDSDISGRTNIFVKDMPLWDAIDMILKSNNLAYQKKGSTLIVSSQDRSASLVSTEIIKLKYANVNSIKETVRSFLSSVGNLQFDSERNFLIITDTTSSLDRIKKLLEELDCPVAQVMLEAKVMEVSSDALEKYGIKWNESITASYSLPSSFAINNPVLAATLNMLQQKGKAKILANPKIATLNNQPARILIGDRVPYSITTYSAQGVAQVTINFVEAGIKLYILPQITDGGFITTTIRPEVSSYVWRGDIPQVSTREIESTIRVKDGETIIIGGLKNNKEVTSVSKVPILGWIPVLEWFFTYQNKEMVESEIIVMITPHILPVESK